MSNIILDYNKFQEYFGSISISRKCWYYDNKQNRKCVRPMSSLLFTKSDGKKRNWNEIIIIWISFDQEIQYI